jgi:hypothetical protein
MDYEKPILRRSLLPTKKEAAPSKTKKRANAKRPGFTVALEDDTLVLRLPITEEDKRKISKSGKSIICAGTSGTRIARHDVDGVSVPLQIAGRDLRICATAWISAEASSNVDS